MHGDNTQSPIWVPTETIAFDKLSNREFLERFARPGRVGLCVGTSFGDKVITRALRETGDAGRWGRWTHAFVFEGVRLDGHNWVIESDLDVHEKHIRLGVQENRIAKYFDGKQYPTLAVLDFGLNEQQVNKVLREGLDLVAARTRYSFRELLGTLLALRRPAWRQQENVLARDCSFYCSALVQYLFRKAGLDPVPGMDSKNTTPDDLSRSPVPHTTYLLRREVATGRTGKTGKTMTRIKRKVSLSLQRAGRRLTTVRR